VECQNDTDGMSRHRFSPFELTYHLNSELISTCSEFSVPILFCIEIMDIRGIICLRLFFIIVLSLI